MPGQLIRTVYYPLIMGPTPFLEEQLLLNIEKAYEHPRRTKREKSPTVTLIRHVRRGSPHWLYLESIWRRLAQVLGG